MNQWHDQTVHMLFSFIRCCDRKLESKMFFLTVHTFSRKIHLGVLLQGSFVIFLSTPIFVVICELKFINHIHRRETLKFVQVTVLTNHWGKKFS